MDDLNVEEIRCRKEKRQREIDQIAENLTENVEPSSSVRTQVSIFLQKPATMGVAKDPVPEPGRKQFDSEGKLTKTSTPIPITKTPNSVKSLRDRWELSSATGTPLHPDNKDDDLYSAAFRMSQQQRKASTSSSASKTTQDGVFEKVLVDTPTRRPPQRARAPTPPPKQIILSTPKHASFSPHRAPSPSITIDTVDSDGSESPVPPATSCSQILLEELLPPSMTSSLTTIQSDEVHTVEAAVHYRPITPNNVIIGSLWDDINQELQKHAANKQLQSDPNLSPRSRYDRAGTGSESFHSISSYRSQGASIKRGMGMGMSAAGKAAVFNSSLESTLPEKRQRSDSEPPSRAESTVNLGDIGSSPSGMRSDFCDGHPRKDASADREAYLKQLHERIIVQQDQICQASRALAFCRQNEYFRGGREEVDAQRALLISTECRRALLQERDSVMNSVSFSRGPRGTLTFSSISIRLSREYINNCVHEPSATNHYYFIVLLKCGGQVLHTSLVSSEKSIGSGFIQYLHYIPIAGLLPDFVCNLEVYSLKSSKHADGTDRDSSCVRSKKGTWRRMVISTPLSAYTNTFSSSNSTGGGHSNRPIGVMDPGFQRVGQLNITRKLFGRQKFMLNDTAYPLDGSCLLDMDCHPDKNTVDQHLEYRSFLSFYQIFSGLGSWSRFWCVLAAGELNFWRYPEDENKKDPMVTLKLSECTTPVQIVPSSTASFPNSMQVEVAPAPQNQQDDDSGPVRLLFAADTEEERDHWLDTINQSIRNSNVWRSQKRK